MPSSYSLRIISSDETPSAAHSNILRTLSAVSSSGFREVDATVQDKFPPKPVLVEFVEESAKSDEYALTRKHYPKTRKN